MATKTRALRTWKNFVLKFRKEFDSALELHAETPSNGQIDSKRLPNQFASLSLLLYALATRLSTVATSEQDYAPEAICADLQRALPPALPFLLDNQSARFPTQFAKIIEAIEATDIKHEPFIIGYTYQYWRDSDRKEAQSEIQSADKQIDKDRLVAFTQIYTPEWVVEFIVANTILPLLEPHLAKRSKLIRWLDSNDDNRETISSPSQISVIDPAAGAGNFLVGAFDALFELHTKTGCSPEKTAQLIAKQLHGCDIDPVALSVATLALVTRCKNRGVESPPVFQGLALASPDKEELLGSLSEDFPDTHPLSKKHDIVITNPPYIGRKLISRHLKSLLKLRFPNSHHDLSAAFFEKSLRLLRPGGRVGLITQASMLFLPSHAKLRTLILDSYKLKTTIDAGPGVFLLQSGEKVNSAIMIVEKPVRPRSSDTIIGASENTASFFNLKDLNQLRSDFASDSAQIRSVLASGSDSTNNDNRKPEFLLKQLSAQQIDKQQKENCTATLIDTAVFRQFRGHAFNYHIPPAVTQLLTDSQRLEEIADIRQGLATTDNKRFVKLIWEVKPEEIGKVWFPYIKGAGGQRYSSPIRHVVNWQDNGADIKAAVSKRYPYLNGKTEWVVKNESYYFKEGLCFSFVNTRGIAVRKLPLNCIFDVGASAIFSESRDFLLSYLNSSFMVALANSLNPTINNQVGDLKRFPVVQLDESTKQSLSQLSRDCSEIKEQINNLIDPGCWYSNLVSLNVPSNHRLEAHPLYETVANLGFDDGFKQYESLLFKLHSQLDSKELEIDEIVLKSVAGVQNWNALTIENVCDWIARYNTRTATSPPPNRKEIFANNLLINQILNSAATMFVGQPALVLRAKPGPYDSVHNETIASAAAISTDSFHNHLEKYFLGFPPEPLRSFDLKGIVSLVVKSRN